MAEIAGVTIDFLDYRAPTNPRIVHIPNTIAEATVQDLIDTLAAKQAEIDNLVYDPLLAAAGKQDLGGGVKVGLTLELQNARASFDSVKGSTHEGTVTTGDANGVTLNDAAAQFVTDAIEQGAWIWNKTDGSVCSVLRVVNETQLITDGLGDGTDNQFDMSDAYEIRNVKQREVSGGNLVAIDSIGDPLSAILPSAGTQVVVARASTATLQELLDIQFSSFERRVLVDVNNDTGLAQPGTVYPSGTRRLPVDNFTDALAIANARGLNTIQVIGQGTTLDSGLDYSGKRFEGDSQVATSMTVAAAANVTNCEFAHMDIDGVFDGFVFIEDCEVGDCDMVAGLIERSGFKGVITLSGGAPLRIVNGHDAIAGSGTPTIDFGGVGNGLIVRGFSGGLVLRNKSGNHGVSLDLLPGRVVIESTVSDGEILVKGVGFVNDQSTGTTTVDVSGLISPAAVWASPVSEDDAAGTAGLALSLARMFATNRLELADGDPGTWTLYKDDGVTPYGTWTVSDKNDGAVTQPAAVPSRRGPLT